MKTAFVTGAGHGIGKAIAVELAKTGYQIGMTYCGSGPQAEETAQEIERLGVKVVSLRVDLSDATQIPGMFETLLREFGGVDVMVNNAGITKYKPFLEVDLEIFDLLTGVDWRGAFFCTQHAAKNMIDRGVHGSIINITSIHRRVNFPQASVYGPTKSALYKFTQHAALELAPFGIRVNSISPGYIKVTEPSVVTEREKMMVSRIPAGRIGQPSEIAAMVNFLISENAAYITGRDFGVDGGGPLPASMDNIYYSR